MFSGAFDGKKVLVTGAAGFKGTWLCMWLLRLGAKVTGYSLDVPSNPSLFCATNIKEKIDHVFW
jgi:CDP-glucose 4,6-dehydratase